MANFYDLANAEIHAVCESSKLKATTAGHIYDLKCHQDLDNGTIVGVGTHVEGQVFNSKTYAAGDIACLVLTAPVAYNGNTYKSEEKFFYNAAGELARAYELHVGDIYTISAKGLTGTPEVGSYIDATNKVAASAGSTGFVGQIIEDTGAAYRILVKKL